MSAPAQNPCVQTLSSPWFSVLIESQSGRFLLSLNRVLPSVTRLVWPPLRCPAAEHRPTLIGFSCLSLRPQCCSHLQSLVCLKCVCVGELGVNTCRLQECVLDSAGRIPQSCISRSSASPLAPSDSGSSSFLSAPPPTPPPPLFLLLLPSPPCTRDLCLPVCAFAFFLSTAPLQL